MPPLLAVLAFALLAPQDSPRALVERLRSEDIAVRESAREALKKLGRQAVPDLERAAADADADLAVLAKRLLRVIALMRSLSPRLLAALPGLEEKLASEDPHAWTEAFLEATADGEGTGRHRHTSLGRAEWSALVARALSGTTTYGERRRICAAISRYRIPGAEEQLPDLVGEYCGADACVKELRIPIAIPRLIARFAHAPDAREIAQLLVEFQIPREEVLKLLDHRSAVVRGHALWMAETLGHITPVIVGKMLKDSSPNVRRHAIERVASEKYGEFIPVLRAQLKPGRENGRAAASALIDLRCTEAAPAILAFLHEEPEGEWDACGNLDLYALMLLPGERALPRLLRLLDADLDKERRSAVLYVMSELRGDGVRDHMRGALTGPEKDLRWYAASALAGMGDRESFDAIARLADAGGNHCEHLFTLDRERALAYTRKRLEHVTSATDIEWAGVLTRQTGVVPQEAVSKLLDHEDAAVRREAVQFLGYHGGAGSGEAIRPLLDDSDPAVRHAAVEAAGRLRTVSAAPALRRLLATNHPFPAAVALGRIGYVPARPEIEALALKAPPTLKRGWAGMAAAAACRLGSRACAAFLLDFLEERPEWVPSHLASLNAVREPRVWQRLSQTPLEAPCNNLHGALASVARQADLKLQLPAPLFHSEAEALSRQQRYGTTTTLLEVLEDLPTLTFILESGALRILPRNAAFDEWRKWRQELK